MSRWKEKGHGRWESKLLGYELLIFATGTGDHAWHVFDPNAADSTLSIASGDEKEIANAKWWADRSAREACLRKQMVILGPEEFDRRIQAEVVEGRR